MDMDVVCFVFFLLVRMFKNGETSSSRCKHSLDEHHAGISMDCSRRNLTSVPVDLPANTTTLNLNHNKLEHLLNHQFLYLHQLKSLSLNSNPLYDIQEEAFNNLTYLEDLQIMGHRLTYSLSSLPRGVFIPLINLRTLTLRTNYYGSKSHLILPDEPISYLTNLISLNIDTGDTVEFGTGFSQLKTLSELILSSYGLDDQICPCPLKQVYNSTFAVFQNISITTLDLSGCVLNEMDKNVFAPFKNLKNLIIKADRNTKLALPDAISTLHVFRNKTLESVTINHAASRHLFMTTAGYFLTLEILKDICIYSLDLKLNRINMVETSNFFKFPLPRLTQCLKHLDLSHNKIAARINPLNIYLGFRLFQNLEYFDISAQFTTDPLGVKSSFEELKHNDSHHTYPFALPSRLKYLFFAGSNRIGVMANLIVIGGTNVIALNMSYNVAVFTDINVTGLMNLQILDLSGNSCLYIARSFFDLFPNLTQLRLSNTYLSTDTFFNIGKRLLQPLSKLEILDLSSNSLGILPHDIFQGLSNLKQVSLSYNNLITIPALSGLPGLQQVYLSKNSLVTIDEDTRQTLDELALNGHKIHLSISGNMLSCNCESLSLLQWLNQTNVSVDGGDYPCISYQGVKTTTGTVNRRFHSLYLHCFSYVWLTVAVTGMSVLVVAMLVSFVFVKNKLKIKLILLRMIGRYVKVKKREDFLYDVCVLYADDVYQWVCHTLRDELEVRRGLKLYLRDRDEVLGADKPTELYNTMESSWKVVLILSPGFLASDFSLSTMSMCLSFITLTTPNRLNLIVDVNLNIPTNIDFFLESVNEENIYRYDINHVDANNPHFWNQIYHGVTAVDNK
ncbi:hypothetical protein SNE40_022269 [Patella caerulea]|uniref:TIR domain-containing protein n=2 Tax=Patella caerulea TaxID=87958 RepID=A0AAN8FW24_PATCE